MLQTKRVPSGRDLFERCRRRHQTEEGIAMIMAVIFMMVMVLIPVAMMTANLGEMPLARYDQDRVAALAAAEAGVEDYINRLNLNPSYYTYNATNLPPSPGNVALQTNGWVQLSQETNTYFHYTLYTSEVWSQGIVLLTSYGRSLNVTRSIEVGLREVGFLDNISMDN